MKIIVDNMVTLSGASVPLLEQLKDLLTMENPLYVEAKRFHCPTQNIMPHLQKYIFNHEDSSFVAPRGVYEDILVIAEGFGNVEVIDQRRVMPEANLHFGGQLRPFHKQAISEVLTQPFGVLEAGTVSGKTVMALAIIATRNQPTLILVHTKELLYKWRDRIRFFLGIEPGSIGDSKFDIQPVTVGIFNTARKHLDELPYHFGHLVVDECHQVPISLFRETVIAFDSQYMLGLWATPYRSDGLDKQITWFMGTQRVTVDYSTLQPIRAMHQPRIISRETDFRYCKAYDEYHAKTAVREDKNRNCIIAADIYKQVKRCNSILVLSDHIPQLLNLAAESNTDHKMLIEKTPTKKCREIVKELMSFMPPVLFSTLPLIDVGIDYPYMDTIILASPFKSFDMLKAAIDRVSMPGEGNEPLLFDYVDNNVEQLAYLAKCRQRFLMGSDSNRNFIFSPEYSGSFLDLQLSRVGGTPTLY